MKVVFRADGNAEIGLGHVIRSLALAEMLKPHAFSCVFAIRNPDSSFRELLNEKNIDLVELKNTGSYHWDELEAVVDEGDIVVLDGYGFDTAYQLGLNSLKCRLICIDDTPIYKYVSDAVINHSSGVDLSAYEASNQTKFYVGLKYAILRPEFMRQAKVNEVRQINNMHKLFLNMGGGDSSNMTKKCLEMVLRCQHLTEVNVIIGGAYDHLDSLASIITKYPEKVFIHYNIDAPQMVSLMSSCDIALVPASSISIELMAAGVGIILGTTASNQNNIYNGLVNQGLAFPIGSIQELTEERLVAMLNQLSVQQINEQIILQKKVVDGDSDDRIVSIFKSLMAYE